MADIKGKTEAFNPDSYVPVHDSFTNTDIHSASEDQNKLVSSEDVSKRLDSLEKADALDPWYDASALWISRSIESAGRVITGGLKAVTDPRNAFNVPTSVNHVAFLSMLDELLAMNPTLRTLPRHSLVEDAGYSARKPLIDKIFEAVVLNKDEFVEAQKQNELMEIAYEKSKESANTEIPFLKPLANWWEKGQDAKADTWAAKAAYWLDDKVRERQEYLGEINTGNPNWDYLLNGSSGLVGSIIGSMALGMGMGAAGERMLATKALNQSAKIQQYSKAATNIAMSAVQTGGETMQVAGDMYKRSIEEQINNIGGEDYQKEKEQVMQDAIKLTLAENPEIDKKDLKMAALNAAKQHQDKWAKENPEAFQQVEKNALKGYHIATALNTLNMAIEPLQTRMYLRGSVKSRGILTKPSVVNWRQALTSGMTEYAEENVNTIAEDAGLATSKGEDYDIYSAFDYAFSSRGFADGAWGFAGGLGEGAFSSMASYKARMKEYQEQLAVIESQNRIGEADASTINKYADLNSSYMGSVASARRITDLEAKGDYEGAKQESERMLSYQAQMAFVSGTTENLIKNYEAVAANEEFTTEAREAARKAVDTIKKMEYEFNATRKYLNANEVYYNRTDQIAIHNAIKELSLKAPQTILDGQEALTRYFESKGIKFDQSTVATVMEQLKQPENPFNAESNTELHSLYQEIHQAPIDGKVKFSVGGLVPIYNAAMIENNIKAAKQTLMELQIKHTNLTSKKTQKSEFNVSKFYRTIAEWEARQKKINPTYSRYESEEFERFFKDLYVSTVNTINPSERLAIRENHENNTLLYNEVKQASEKAAAEILRKQQEVNQTPSVTPPSNNVENNIIQEQVDQFSKLVEGTNAGDDILPPPVKNAADFVVDDDGYSELFGNDPKIISNNLSDELKSQMVTGINQLYAVMKGDNANFGFKDLLTEFIARKGLANAEHNANSLIKAWVLAKLPGYETLDFNKIKDEFFQSADQLMDNWITFNDKLPAEKTEEEGKEESKLDLENQQEQEESLNNGITTYDNTGTYRVEPQGNILATPNATISYTSTYNQEINIEENGVVISEHKLTDTQIYVDQFAPGSTKLLHPTIFKPGSLLKATIHPDFMSVPINTYDKNGKVTGRLPFEQWLEAENNTRLAEGKPTLTPTSAEYIANVPMAIIDQDGEIIGLVPDLGRISDFHNRPDTQNEYKKNVLSIRNAVHNNTTANLKVLNKTLGFSEDLMLPYEQSKLLKDCDTESIIAVGRAGKLEFMAGQKAIDEDQIVFDKRVVRKTREDGSSYMTEPHPRHGLTYDLRKCGVITEYNADGTIKSQKDQYFPFYTNIPSTLSEEGQNTVYWAINAYLNKRNNQHPDYAKILNIIYNLKHKANIDLDTKTNIIQLSNYIKMFVFTHDTKGTSVEDVVKKIQTKATSTGTPFLFTQDGKIVIGTAFPPVQGAKGDMSGTNFITSDEASFMEKLRTHLPLLRKNVSSEGLRTRNSIQMIDAQGNVREAYKNYDEYVRSNMSTRGDAREVTVNHNGKQVKFRTSFVQPRVEIALTDDKIPEAQQAATLQTGVVPEATIDLIARKIFAGEKLTPEERVAQVNAAKEVQDKVDKLQKEQQEEKPVEEPLFPFQGMMLTKAQIQEKIKELNSNLKDKGIKPKSNESLDPRVLENDEREKIIASSQIIKGLSPVHEKQIVDYIFNQIAIIVNNSNSSTVNLETIKQAVRNVFDNNIVKRITEYQNKLNDLRTVLEIDPTFENIQESIDRLEAYLDLHKIVTDNWKKFEDQALIMVKKYMNIKEAITTDLNDATEDTENDADIDEVSGEKENNFSKRAEEISVKESVSADIKRLCQTIQEVDANGEPVLGIFDVPIYVGFDTVFNSVSAWLAEASPDFTIMENILKEYAVTHKWVPQLLEKLNPKQDEANPKPVNKQLQNEFVSAMSKHALDMEFVMMVKDRNGRFSLKIYSTNSGAIARSLITSWKSNIIGRKLIMDNKDGNYVFNRDAIIEVMDEYQQLKNQSILPSLSSNDETILKRAVAAYLQTNGISNDAFFDVLDTKGNIRTIAGKTVAKKETLINAIGNGKVKITNKGKFYSVQYIRKSDEFVIKKMESLRPVDALINWLANFGIDISKETANEIITKGFRYSNSKKPIPYEDQWKGEESGKEENLLGTLHGTLYQILQNINNTRSDAGGYSEIIYDETDIDGDKILGQSIIKALAAMEAKHTTHRVVQSFYDNHKSIYGFTASKYITDRVKQLKVAPEQNELLHQLKNISFSKNSAWLELLENDAAFRENFKVIHLGLTALKELGKTLYRDNDLQALSDIDHELVKIGFFQQEQGEVKAHTVDNPLYHGLKFRLARMFSPTMSDKGTMTLIKTAVLDITRNTLITGNYNKMLDFTYSQVISPEMQRISNFKLNVGKTNIKAYDKGAGMFFMMPALNYMKFTFTDNETGNEKEVSLLGLLNTMPADQVESLVVRANDKVQSVKEHLKEELDAHIKNEQQAKIEEWKKAKFVTTNEEGAIVGIKYLDKNYIYHRGGNNDAEKVEIAALDFCVNSMIANANSYMTIAGDPAMCFKKEPSTSANDYMAVAEQTLINVGKRLADQIAPRNKLADSENNKYIHLFLADNYTISDRIKYIVRSLDGKEISDDQISQINDELITNGDRFVKDKYKDIYPKSVDYLAIESTNAQEYTTWKEHLYVLEKLGKLPNVAIGISQAEIEQAREIFSGNKKMEDLSDAQKALVQKVLQPMKPVYTGQVYAPEYDAMRKMYIKTSAFPLIPQLTAGLEIDKLAKAMERIEQKTGKTVRASYESGNKVGAIASPLRTTDNTGRFIDYSSMADEEFMTHMGKYTLELPRSNFGIQQNVPFKSAMKDEDVVSMGTQITKLLFGNIVMKLNNFNHNGVSRSGKELHELYTDTFSKMVSTLRNDLYNEVGINVKTGMIKDNAKTLKKITSILQSEASLRGYPKQDLEALGIDPETGKFNLPIWLSPNAMRYEALLAAIITHRIVKIKFPGYSYVAGSQSGFKMQDTLEGIDQSNIVFTDKWTGELKGNQVLIPCKFRVNGKLVDLIKDGYAKKDANGKWMVDTDKVDPALLSNIPSFRIPSSKHSSMENLEIAGFLPYNSADLLVVSADGTVAMGEDYDIDKRYTYHHWTTVENGKIIPLHQSDTYKEEGKTPLEVVDELIADNEQQISDLKKAYFSYKNKIQQIEDLLDEIEVAPQYGLDVTEQTKRVEKLQKQLENKNADEITNDIKLLKDAIKKLKKDKIKLYQNQIIDIHSTVLNHPEVKKLTVEKLSIQDAANDAEFLDGMNDINKRYFTPLSDRYQKSKVAIGAVGKNGTAAYSLDVVSHSLFEQAYQSGKPIQLIEYVKVEDDSEKGYHMEAQNLEVRFGNYVSNGELGHERTLDGERAVSDVHSERQNLMVDNEKEQIAIRVHLNDITMRVDKVLNFLRFDKGEDGRSISFMFISQPIIKKYVKMMENENSNTTDYDANKKNRIINTLLQELGYDSQESVDNRDQAMTNEYMISQIKDGGSDKAFQAAVLVKFLKLENYGTNLTTVQTTLNVDSKGVGKNLLEAMEKLESIKNLPENKYIQGVEGLIGDYQYAESIEEARYYGSQGYIVVGDIKKGKGVNERVEKLVMIKPTTVSGVFAVNGLVSATQIWGKFFPYEDKQVRTMFEELMEVMGNSEMSDTKKVELKQTIFNDMKKYLYTDQTIGALQDNVQKERFRLFIDQYGKAKKGETTRPIIKESLASFMNNLTKNPSEDVKKLLRSNRLISRFQYEISTNGGVSLIKFNNSAAENFDEQFMYNSIIELVEANIPLGKFNGKDYTSTDLAQDLVAYAYLEGGIQEAIQFVKYLPVSYLKVWGINNIVEKGGFTERKTLGIKEGLISTFGKQFVQHHAGQVKKVTETDMADKTRFKVVLQGNPTDLSTLQRFTLEQAENDDKSPFLSIYNEKLPKGQSKYQLYQFDKGTGQYVRIPTLGVFGMSEYMAEHDNYPSLVNQPKNIVSPITPAEAQVLPNSRIVINRFQTSSGDPKKIVDSISQMDSQMGKLAKQLSPLISRTTKFEVVPMNDANGKFNRETNTILISEGLLLSAGTTNEQLATVIMREVVHSICDGELKKYTQTLPINPATGYREFVASSTAPAHIKKLVSVFAEAQKALNKNGELKLLTLKGREQGITPQEYAVTYGGYDIFEFVERMMTTPELRATLDKEPFRESGLSITQKFIEWIAEVMNEVKKNLNIATTEGTITDHAMANIFELMNSKAEAKQQKKEDYEAEKTIMEAESLLGEALSLDDQKSDSIDDLLGPALSMTDEQIISNQQTMFDEDGNYIVDENDEFAGLDPKIINFGSVVESMLKSGSLTIKC